MANPSNNFRLTDFAAIAVLAASSLMGYTIVVAQDEAKSTAPTTVPQVDDATQVRVRELIYILRQHRVFERTDEWGAAIQELTKLGRPALPELLLELKETERGTTLRGLLFTLRAIDDPRAIPFVIEALPKAERLSNSGSDCGLRFANPDLQRFMKRNQDFGSDDDDSVSYGRPINEILATLHKLSRTATPDLTKGLDPSWNAGYWREWWKAKQASGSAPTKDAKLQLASRKEDLVERDGIRKFGPLFPTGAGQHLSPPAEVRLASSSIADAPSALDFETGRVYEYLQGMHYAAGEKWNRMDIVKWWTQNGIDLDATGGRDLHLWLIENDRWNSLDAEVRSNDPFNIGRDATSIWSFGSNAKADQIGTFLFTTREGSRGVLRFHRMPNGGPTRFEYRLWNRDAVPVKDRRPPSPGDPDEWHAQKIVILKEPAIGNPCLFDLETGESDMLPASIFAPDSPPDVDELLSKRGAIFNDDRIAKWARSRGIDIASHRSRVFSTGEAKLPEQIGQLTILDARMAQVTLEAFDNLTFARAKEILARSPERFAIAYLSPPLVRDGPPTTFLVETKSGLIGLITILNVRENLISFQYKTAHTAKNAKADTP